MWTSLITGVFTLVGVSLGVVLEPLRMSFAERARLRSEGADRCVRLVEAATLTRSLLLEINYLHRREGSGDISGVTNEDEIFAQYRAARKDLKQVVMLLHLSGPDEVADAAEAVRRADRSLRATRFVTDLDHSPQQRDEVPVKVRSAADLLDQALLEFVKIGRKFI